MTVRDKLDQDLKNYKRLILISSSFEQCHEVIDMLRKDEELHIYCSFEIRGSSCNVECISLEQEREMLDFYYMYEFSDRFTVVDNNQQYGSLWNYVEAGILTFDEAVEAIGS